ncbi:MAG TPA: prolyl oligopeptidase family serine peptidase [Acidimicrobiales bacterium]
MLTTGDYGRRPPPLTAGEVARGKVSLAELCSDGAALYWLESRPDENGRVAFVRAGDEGATDHSPAGVSIRSRVHEYGGGAVCLVPGDAPGAFAYVDQSDQRVWLCNGPSAAPGSATPRPLSAPAPEGSTVRHGGLSATADGHWVLAVRETHANDGRSGRPRPPRRSIVAFSTQSSRPSESTLLEGHDFFGAPRVDATAARLAVVVWEHPNMQWDASSLVVVPLGHAVSPAATATADAADPGTADDALIPAGPAWVVAGGPEESIGQPDWQRDGTLRFVSDRRGWWQPYVHPGTPDTGAGSEPLTDVAAEFHGPDWVLGQTTFAELPDGTVLARQTSAGRDALVRLRAGAAPDVVVQPCVSIAGVCAHGEGVALIGSTPDAPTNVWLIEPGASPRPARAAPASSPVLRTGEIAHGEPFTVTGRSGRAVYGTLYRPPSRGAGPTSPGSTAERDIDPPPLITWCHSGPTSACQAGLDLTLQFFTTRGFAVACVDYAGSTGYGRAYRCELWGQWGVADAEDCLDASRHLADRGDVDRDRMAVRGGSAGGMTALNALAAGEGFKACTALYAVTDLLSLAATTHDFEAHYNDRLIGPLPEARDLFVERSPVSRAFAMTGAVLLLQGTDDAVVPPAQAERMREALVGAGTPCDLRFFEGEGHGFRRADTLTACLEAELGFYLEVLHL